jgi:hemerythrin
MATRLSHELTVGFDEIDAQHLRVLDALEAAAAATRSGDLGAVRAAVGALGDVLVSHFASEEELMAEALYPERSRHKAAHDLFLQDLAQLGRELEVGWGTLVAHWIVRRIPEWVKFHILVNDLPLGQYLAARRVRQRAPAPGLQKRTVS